VSKAIIVGIFVLVLSKGALGQGSEPPRTFPVASVRPSGPVSGGRQPLFGTITGGPGTSDPERIAYFRVNLLRILVSVFGIQDDQIFGPDWLLNDDPRSFDVFDIAAIVPPGTTKEQSNEMMQNLLKERFHFAFHREKRNLDIYQLVVAKGGPRLNQGEPANGPAPPRSTKPLRDEAGFPQLPPGYPNILGVGDSGHMRVTARMTTAAELLKHLTSSLGTSHVVDRTGLVERYDFKLDYSMAGLPVATRALRPSIGRPEPAPSEEGEAVSDLFTALERQLGLKLEKTQASFDVLIVDHVDRIPTAN
jgi:uncharacterized protein (TIGR03435 family)